MAELLATYGVRIAGMIRALRVVAASYRAGLAAASVALAGECEMLLPLLGARPMLADVGDLEAGGPGVYGLFRI